MSANFNVTHKVTMPQAFPLKRTSFAVFFWIYSTNAISHGLNDLEVIEVKGRSVNMVGGAQTSSEGMIGQPEIALRPLSRTGEVLEFIPGMVVTQHSGSGKANQYFLRGFNLDHGSDFQTNVDGMPVNMVSHGHGQGYTDINFIIPELVANLRYQKGPYFADTGDFSGAGSANIQTLNKAITNNAKLTVGDFGYVRGLFLGGVENGSGNWVYAAEQTQYQGPWDNLNEDVNSAKWFTKYRHVQDDSVWQVTYMGYTNEWNSADQVPQRAIEQRIISQYGSIDTTVGGNTQRHSVNARWANSNWSVGVYAIQYDMQLWSNFTYFLDDNTNGDQFEQVDDRLVFGGEVLFHGADLWGSYDVENTLGVQIRSDSIDEVGLYKTIARTRIGAIRSDDVEQSSVAAFWQNQIQITGRLKSTLGIRYDQFDFDVNSLLANNIHYVDLTNNQGSRRDDMTSFKASMSYLINYNWEAYIGFGQGFHSNDARGTVIQVDPLTGDNVEQVEPLVRNQGYEVGVRGFYRSGLNTSLTFWSLESDSELVFVGDAGNTEASAGSKRTGFEYALYYQMSDRLHLDVEYALSDAKFVGVPSSENSIPGALESVLQFGITAEFLQNWRAQLRLRYFGPRPLTEDNSQRSSSSNLTNLLVNYRQTNWHINFEVLNLFNSTDHDIDYFYESQLAAEVNPVSDRHVHTLEPRAVRVTLAYNF